MEYKGSTTTTRSFTLGGGTLEVDSGKTVILDGSEVSGGHIAGPGTFQTDTASAAYFLSDTADTNATITSVNKGDHFKTFIDLGTINFDWTSSTTSTINNLDGFTLGSSSNHSASVTISPADQVLATDFTSYAVLTISPTPSTSGVYTLFTNNGSSQLELDGGSDTEIGSVATASGFHAGVDLHGYNAHVYQALLNNDGFVADSVGGGEVSVDGGGVTHGSLAKGAGGYYVTVATVSGGYIESGDCPGMATYDNLTFGPAGAEDYRFQIDDAAGTAGPTPDSTGHVDGWGLVSSSDLNWTATSDQKLTIDLQSLATATTEGNDVAGTAANFDPTQSYSWAAVTWTGTYTGPTDDASLNAATVFDTSAFQNTFSGTFGWHLDTVSKTLYLTYTPA